MVLSIYSSCLIHVGHHHSHHHHHHIVAIRELQEGRSSPTKELSRAPRSLHPHDDDVVVCIRLLQVHMLLLLLLLHVSVVVISSNSLHIYYSIVT